MENKSIILLSGGLDSLAGLAHCKDSVQLALTFDYGQKACKKEIEASKKICEFYSVEHKVIKLDWLKNITKTALVSSDDVPLDNFYTQESAKKVWVPNRNGLFLNIAACFADSFGFESIIIGANAEEAETFPDNSLNFINSAENCFKFSTQKQPKIIAPLIGMDKNEIVAHAIKLNAPLELVISCYQDSEGNCGLCESCLRLKNALKNNKADYFIKKLF